MKERSHFFALPCCCFLWSPVLLNLLSDSTADCIKKYAGSLGSQAYFLTDYYGSEVVDGDFVLTLASSNYTSIHRSNWMSMTHLGGP